MKTQNKETKSLKQSTGHNKDTIITTTIENHISLILVLVWEPRKNYRNIQTSHYIPFYKHDDSQVIARREPKLIEQQTQTLTRFNP